MSTPIRLKHYDNSWYDPGGGLLKRAAWFFVGQPILRAAWIPSSGLRVQLLRMFGAQIGSGVVIKPAVDVKYPWHLVVGDHCWIGERTWIDNLTTVRLGSDVCVSQGAYFCTGNHDWTDPHFGLRIKRIQIGDGAWVGARSILTPGTVLGAGAVAAAGSVVVGNIPDFEIFAGNPAHFVKSRVLRPGPHAPARPTVHSIRAGSVHAAPP
jgi:putative colanic acid biosynthesis acetyltransferase WcaF